LPLNENKYLHFTKRNLNGNITSDLFIFKDEPCYFSHEYNWNIYSKLEKGEGTGCKANDRAKDSRYIFLDSYNQSKFYKENNIFRDLDYNLIGEDNITKLENSEVNLYHRVFIGFNYSCLKERKINDVYSEFSDLKNSTEEERLFISKISNDINLIIEQFGETTLKF